MYAEEITKHFVRFLGSNVGVSLKETGNLVEVTLYRPDRVSDTFVLLAFEQLKSSSPRIAGRIDKLIVSYEGPLGGAQHGVDISFIDRSRRLPNTASETKAHGLRELP